jgi:hypothetical protein
VPASRKRREDAILFAPWVEAIEDTCLQAVVVEALIARKTAVTAHGDPKIIESGDKTLDSIEFGRITGAAACKKAATAVRKFDEAYMSVQPTRYGHALRKRYARKAKRAKKA